MIDEREAVAKEFTDHLLNVTFSVPRGWSDAQAQEHVSDVKAVFRWRLPRHNGEVLRDLCERVRRRLKASSRANTWPTIKEITDALRDEQTRNTGSARDGDLPEGDEHPGKGWFVNRARRWIERFDDWPTWLGPYEPHVIDALVGEFSPKYFHKLGAAFTSEQRERYGIARGRE